MKYAYGQASKERLVVQYFIDALRFKTSFLFTKVIANYRGTKTAQSLLNE